MANQKLAAAKDAKKDEFYTQYEDIQREINAYIEYDPNVFRDKVVLLPCDDPEWSNFTRFFAQKGLRTKSWTMQCRDFVYTPTDLVRQAYS